MKDHLDWLCIALLAAIAVVMGFNYFPWITP